MTRDEKKALYAGLCERGRITALFMQPWWLDATGSWDVALGVRNGQVVGAMPYTLKRRWGVTLLTMPSFTHHLQIWMDKPPDISAHKWLTREKQIIWLLIEDLPAYGYFSMVFEETSFDNWLPFHWKGFRQEMRYTFVLTKEMFENEDQGISRNLRRHLRDASGHLRIQKNIAVPLLFDTCRHTYQRQNIKMPFTVDQLETVAHAVDAHQAGIRLGAYSTQNELVAVSWLLWDQNRAYYFVAGDTKAGRDTGASIFLCHEAMRIAFEEKGLTAFDFCGSMLETVTDMRRQFGAKSEGLMKIFRARYRWLEVLRGLRG